MAGLLNVKSASRGAPASAKEVDRLHGALACRAAARIEELASTPLCRPVRAVHLSGCASGVAVGQCASDQPIRCGEPETKRI